MLKITVLILCAAAIIVSGAEDDLIQGKKNAKTTSMAATPIITDSTTETTITTPTTTPTSTTTTPSITTNGTTEDPVTTPATTTTTTTTTTTPETTTTSATTTTTTSATTTTTTAPVTPTPPAPVPAPTAGKWIINQKNITCIIAQMAVQLNVTYVTKDQKEAYKVMNMPADSLASGYCGTEEQNLTLSWKSMGTVNDSMHFHFVKNATTKQYSLHHLEVLLTSDDFPEAASNNSLELLLAKDEFSTGLSNSYRCLRGKNLNLTDSSNKIIAVLELSELQFQAFHTENSTNFGLAEDCAFDTPDIVPIAVGCALAALVVIVLAAYLMGRRRSQARGYLSM